jgi:hypothetical protein
MLNAPPAKHSRNRTTEQGDLSVGVLKLLIFRALLTQIDTGREMR